MTHHDETTEKMIEIILDRLHKLNPVNVRRVMIVAMTLLDAQQGI